MPDESLERAQLIGRLRAAECIDRMTSESWTKNPTLEQYYADKAEDVRRLRSRLEQGGIASQQEVNEALDTSKARRWSGFSY